MFSDRPSPVGVACGHYTTPCVASVRGPWREAGNHLGPRGHIYTTDQQALTPVMSPVFPALALTHLLQIVAAS